MSQQKVRDQAYIKQSNIHSVLKLLRTHQPVSRKDIIRLSGMSPTSITRIAGALLDLSLVLEGESPEDAIRRGRKAISLRTNPDGLYTIGILFDRKEVKLCVLNFDNENLYTASVEMEQGYHTPQEVAEKAHALFEQIPTGVVRERSHVRGIGVSVPGIVNHLSGVVELSIQMQWSDIDIRQAFEQLFGLPVWVENDVKAALIGEKDLLGIPRMSDAAYLFISKGGLSTALTSGGELLRGERNAAGEVAHIVLAPSDLPCDCGQYGCLQLHLLETYLIRRAQKIDESVTTLEDIITAAQQKLSWAEILISDFKRHFMLVISMLDSFCNPAKIIVSGSTVDKFWSYLEPSLPPGHVILTHDFTGASVRGVAILAMQQTLIQRLAESDKTEPA